MATGKLLLVVVDSLIHSIVTCVIRMATGKLLLMVVDSLIHSIVTRVIRMATGKSLHALPPALVETYSRLLVYIEIESLGIKGFISQYLFIMYYYVFMFINKYHYKAKCYIPKNVNI